MDKSEFLKSYIIYNEYKNVVEIGTGAGVSALWLLDGMHPDGVLTSVDIEAEHQLIAKDAISQAGIAPNRVRLAFGDPVSHSSRRDGTRR
jgi:predicted O-methyltransferase YrrM